MMSAAASTSPAVAVSGADGELDATGLGGSGDGEGLPLSRLLVQPINLDVLAGELEARGRGLRVVAVGEEQVIGCGGVGGPASILSKKLMPDIEVTNIRDEERFIVR